MEFHISETMKLKIVADVNKTKMGNFQITSSHFVLFKRFKIVH